ncbi:Os03g0862200 [Oryza sativa Japonica Group]|jgi:hypothetical protein|nr:hypothetical protein EE612_021813 [Oryza sativa]BAS87500.1 Os03g0862200 [Oryza sativa Japonica Group]
MSMTNCICVLFEGCNGSFASPPCVGHGHICLEGVYNILIWHVALLIVGASHCITDSSI